MQEVRKLSIIDQVVDSIKNSIISGDFPIGSKLPSELMLCKMMNVSRSTIREACRVLQTRGYVELKPGRGAFVCENEPRDLDTIRFWFKKSAPKLADFFEVRLSLEGLACRKAAMRGTQEQIESLETNYNAFLRAISEVNVPEIALLDEQFHSIIAEMTYNPLLININNLIAMEFKKYRSISFAVQKNATSAIHPHFMILDAIKRKDSDDAEFQMTSHLHQAVQDIDLMDRGK